MQKFKTTISALALTLAITSGLTLAGCNKKEATLNTTKVQTRVISETQAVQALKVMGLDQSGSSHLVWTNRTGGKGNYVFSNVGAKKEKKNKTVMLGTLELKGVRMDGELAVFDQVVFNDVKAVNKDDIITLNTFSLTNPSPVLADAIGQLFNGDEDALDDLEGDVRFSAISFTGFDAKSDEGTLKLASLKAGETSDGTGMFTLKDMQLDIQEKKETVTMSLGAINVAGVNIDKYKGIFDLALKDGKDGNEAAFKNIMSSLNPYNPDFKSFALNDFDLNANGLLVNLESLVGKAEQKGGKVYMSQTMTPLTITPPKDAKDKELRRFKDAMDTLGYNTLAFTMAQNSVLDEKADSMIVKDSYFALKDGFKLSFDYDMIGYKAYLQDAVKSGDSKYNPMAVMGMLNKLKVNTARIALKDDSIVERAFKLVAKEQGSSPDTVKQQAKMGLAFLPMMAKDEGQQKLAGDLSEALGDWLDDGGTLVVNMAPEKPVVIGSIAEKSVKGDFDVSTLGITITRE